MQVFLTGATGYIGSAVLDAMIKGGHRVTALARDPEKAERLLAKGATPIIGELGLPKTYIAAVQAAEAVVHTAMESSPRGIPKEKEALQRTLAAASGNLTRAAELFGVPRTTYREKLVRHGLLEN